MTQLVGASSHKPKGCRFNSQSGHMPRLLVGPWSGNVWEATNHFFLSHWCFSPSLSPSLPNSLESISKSSDEVKKYVYIYFWENEFGEVLFTMQINLICFRRKLFLTQLLSANTRKTNVNEIFSWLFILNYVYDKALLVLQFLTNKISMTWWTLSGLLIIAIVFQSLLLSAPIHDFEKVKTHTFMKNISNYIRLTKQIWIIEVCWIKNINFFHVSLPWEVFHVRKVFA